MTGRITFLIFHHKTSVWGAAQVYNYKTFDDLVTWFVDAAEWDSIIQQDGEFLDHGIYSELGKASMTIVLWGRETSY